MTSSIDMGNPSQDALWKAQSKEFGASQEPQQLGLQPVGMRGTGGMDITPFQEETEHNTLEIKRVQDSVRQRSQQRTATSAGIMATKRQQNAVGRANFYRGQSARANGILNMGMAKRNKLIQDFANERKRQHDSINSRIQQNQQNRQQDYGVNSPSFDPATAGANYNGDAGQIAQMARAAGFTGSDVGMAVAIAMAESGGKASAVNNANTNGSSDYGLMQINTIHKGLLNNHKWSDPMQNMQMAFKIFSDAGSKWTPWSTFNNGSYKQYADMGASAAQSSRQKVYVSDANMPQYQSQTGKGLRMAIVANAKRYQGVPYKWGGNSLKNGVDCSGLVQQVYRQMGIELPRTAQAQAHTGVRTSVSNLLPGDLVAWGGGWQGDNPSKAQSSPDYVGHIAIYAGGGNIIEAQQDGVPVHTRSLRPDENVFGVKLTNVLR